MLFDKPEKTYIEVVLTGGPSAGKTTAISTIINHYSERGIRVICAPEMATMLITGGLSDLHTFRAENILTYNKIQSQILLLQRSVRNHYTEIAESMPDEKVLIVYDRAECDCRAYMTEESFQATLQDNHLSMEQVRDSYDAVIHMVTAADGAAEHYNFENNPARLETVDEAIAADQRTLDAWLGHPHLRVVDNSTDFKGKLDRLIEHIDHSLTAIGVGGEGSIEYERRFLLAESPELTEGPLVGTKKISVTQTYLMSEEPGVEVRVRKWADGSQVSYFWTRKKVSDGEGREEKEALIKPSEYVHLLNQQDPDRQPIQKTRYCFVHDGRHCELDRIKKPDSGFIWVLEVELNSEEEEFTPPPSFNIEKEVTGLPEYSNQMLALGNKNENN